MKVIFRNLILSLVIILSTFALPAASQSIEDLLLLQSEMDLEKFENFQENSNKDTGVPTSDTFIIPNAENAASEEGSIIQSISPNSQDESVIQRYYNILTGKMLPVYGVSEFQQQQDSRLLFFNTMGKEYRLAAGDVLRITLRGLYESDSTYKIGRDGNLILPSLAPLNVSGITISEAERRLLNILRYDDASAAVYISLETARLVTVQVSGAVKNPRTLAIPAFTPLSRVLAYSGGIKETGSLRDIVLRDRDGSTTRIDFYDFLKSPSGANDPLVTDASRIFVGNQGNTVAANGFVARPGIYELPDGHDKINVRELLDLTGTRIIPPGLVVEALYFDAEGLSQARVLGLDNELRSGEVLNLRFLPTRLTNMIRVKGAVLEEYDVATSSKVSISQLLRDGATLREDAFLDFALIIDEKLGTRAVDLTEVFNGKDEFVNVGSEVQVFTAEKLRQLASAPVNQNTDKILSALLDAEVAELYVNGLRIAYLPPSISKPFSEVIRPFYRLTPYTSYDLAIFENGQGEAAASSLRDKLKDNNPMVISGGDKIYIFENSFLQVGSSNQNTNFDPQFRSRSMEKDELSSSAELNSSREDKDTAGNNYLTWKTLSKLFARAGILRIQVDGLTKVLLPHSRTLEINSVLEKIGFELTDNLSDFAVLTASGSLDVPITKMVSIYANLNQPIENFNRINFFTKNYLAEIIASPTTEEFKILEDISVNLYQDYTHKGFGSPESLSLSNSFLGRQVSDPNLYPLFAIHEYYNSREGFWQKEALSLSALSTKEFGEKVEAGSRIFTFTHDFIAQTLGASTRPSNTKSSRVSKELREAIVNEDPQSYELATNFSDKEEGLNGLSNSVKMDIDDSTKDVAPEQHSKFIFSSTKFVTGAVERPGYFPVSGEVTLSQLLAAAGGLTEDADTSSINVIRQSVSNGTILPDQIQKIDLSKVDPENIVLNDRYSLNIPSFINDVASAIVNLEGEVRRPGEYLVSRNETLHQVISRAGGLTDVAYPLGAVFTRNGIKTQQRDSNNVLATQLEQAVLELSQSERDGAGAQIEAILLFASQLRSQEVQGRLSVNVTLEDPYSPVFLEQGDTLFVPKRPAHVSVIGSVQKDTVARYSSKKYLADYLANAGGINKIADLGQAYILLPNGESISAGRSTLIPAGSVIVVPPKTDRLNALGLADIVARVLGNIATSVLAINNVK